MQPWLQCIAAEKLIPIRFPLPQLRLSTMARRAPRASELEEEGIQWDIRSATDKKATPQPFDDKRTVLADPRDPRTDPGQWPCFGQHVPMKAHANPHGRWVHCSTCNLRLQYTPRVGSHGQNTKTDSPPLTIKMLTQLYEVMGGRTPTATICLLMQKKIDADDAQQGMVEPVFQRVPQLSEKPPFYDKEMIKVKKGNKKSSRDTSPAPSWDKVGTPPTSPPSHWVELQDYMDPSEMEHLMKMLQERKAAAKLAVDMETGSGSLASAYEQEAKSA